MQLKKYTRFQMDFSDKWTEACGALMGLSFFLRIAYYFGLRSLRDVGIVELLTFGIGGILLCGAYVVFQTCLRRNAPGLYGIMGAAHCLLIFILVCSTGNVGRIILALIWYAATAVVLLMTVGGYLPGRLLAGVMFLVPIFVRFFFFDLGHIGIIRWVQELAVLSTLAAFGCFAMGLKPSAHHK